ncbi:MAG: carbon-nitrogen hydrolase family protein [Desulfobulbus sp.]|jgi:predicted amidohydrolase|uniref:carbon-nitrogen hydrolase family protein n=1 Tax=Desulfobulbus sp. TaxID=895 RepID=UPI00284CC629|nr:carbon-nitrogen hydrolase family protein [Desulfobulbus sp.]MDR2549789.1 carbon-nitrogen hydrolase family protein [Desulfobulbus sp.]
MPSLKLAFLHLAVEHKQPERNRQHLLDLCREAGEKKAQLVVAPELALSGYSFTNIRDMEPYAETADGPTLRELAGLCRTFGYYLCVGMAERDAQTGMLFNSAFVLGPEGTVICRYRKINAEFRWACPGDPNQDNTFATPWGRVGVLICSDSYHSLMPRVTALRGARLLLVPANWPPSGLDPLEIWRARALENGLFVAACNRTGQDVLMDCRQAPSALASPHGTLLMQKCARTSKLIRINLPLNGDGLLKSGQRLKRLSARPRAHMRSCALNVGGIADLTSCLQLPPPGKLSVWCHCSDPDESPAARLAAFTATASDGEALHILPAGGYGDGELAEIHRWCAATGLKATLVRATASGTAALWFDGGAKPMVFPWDYPSCHETAPFPALDCGPARVCLLPQAALCHPELVLARAKEGADLALIFGPQFDDAARLLGGARTIEQTAVAVCTPEGGGIWMPLQGHQRWEEVLAEPGGHCRLAVDTAITRNKRFQDRIDYFTLLRSESPNDGIDPQQLPRTRE